MGCSLKKSVAEELIVAYAARKLGAAAEADFERHLKACASCREMVTQQRAVWAALEEWQPQAVSSDFDQKLAACIAQNQRTRWWHGFLRTAWRPLIPVAAASAVLVFAFLLKDNDRAAAPAPESKVRIEQQVEHALDDMDMLNQIRVDVSSAKPGFPQKI